MELKKPFIVAGLVAALTGCIDSGDDETSEEGGGAGGAERISFTGLVADGYLDGATVCLDINNNKECDDDEPTATSGAGGTYEITDPLDTTEEERNNAPLLVVVIPGETVDEDTVSDANPNGVAFTKPLTLSAPAGYTFISPLTTMVQKEVDSGATPEAAKATVQNKLGTTLDLNTDYVAGKASAGSDAAGFEKLHKVAQVTARVISDNIEKLEEVANDPANNISIDALISAIVDEVFEALDEITVKVDESDPEDDFNPDAVAQAVDEEVVDLETDTIEDVIAINEAEKEAEANAGSLDVAALVLAGFNFIEARFEWDEGTNEDVLEVNYGNVKNDANGDFVEAGMEWNGTAFVSVTQETSESAFVLDTTGWVEKADFWTPDSLVGGTDGTLTINRADGLAVESYLVSEVNIAGLNVRNIASKVDEGDGILGNYVPASTTFSTGAKGYKVKETAGTGTFVEVWTDCEASYLASRNGNCNTVEGLSVNGVGQSSPTALDVFVSASSGYISSDDYSTNTNRMTLLQVGYADDDSGKEISAELIEGGVLNFYEITYGTTNFITKLASSTWTSTTQGTATYYTLNPISALANYDTENLILTVIDGFVRSGDKFEAEDGNAQLAWLNDIALGDIVDNFSLDNVPLALSAPCSEGDTVWDGQTSTIPTSWSLPSAFETAVTNCLAGSPEVAAVESDIVDLRARSLSHAGASGTYLANKKGVFVSDAGDQWFDWDIVDDRLVVTYHNGTTDVTSTHAGLKLDEDQAYSQLKRFDQYANVTDGFGTAYGFVSVGANELSSVAGIAPAVAFSAVVEGTYTVQTPDGDATFELFANGRGVAHFPPEPDEVEGHPGYDDDISWVVDTSGRFILSTFSIEEDVFHGVDRLSLATGTQTSGTINVETINENGRYQSILSGVTWTRTNEGVVSLTGLAAAGVFEEDLSAVPGKTAYLNFIDGGDGTGTYEIYEDDNAGCYTLESIILQDNGGGSFTLNPDSDNVGVNWSISSNKLNDGESLHELASDQNILEGLTMCP